ncbi:hypothetical protein FSP39_020508 [Pinctada imbricata]|uniref:Temptin Cys/Cys disulfide domain-containing protein n=1 Tax=Pinctada imbricata TaxID=66713 RepID=A0AA89BRM0_PINIB|nr:hypothetical protein FSP39_020508 [Pinctada imbricata]
MLKSFFVVQFIGVCFAFPGYRSRIPNGMNVPNPCSNTSGVWKGVGHNVEGGGGPRNVFGKAFLEAKKVWTKELCQADSDTDGKTNGEELGDPNCTWTEGSPVPGNATGHPAQSQQPRKSETEGIQNQDKTGTKANKQNPPPHEKKRTPDMGVRPGAQEE